MTQSTDDSKVCRIASLTLVNALIFQQILATNDKRIPPLARITQSGNTDLASKFADIWLTITTDIDYVPIFTIARQIALDLQGLPDTDDVFRTLSQAAMSITSKRAALRHDLMGRVYHRLLADAKYFGAYYTTVPAASLLLKLTLSDSASGVNWSDVENVKNLRVADLACGTGTLLKATLQTVIDNHVRSCAANSSKIDLPKLHRALIEDVLYGLDVIPFAIHLAASALAIHEPDVQFSNMNLYTLPLGGSPHPKLGSIELLQSGQVLVQADLFGSTEEPLQVTGGGDIRGNVSVPDLDLCVMNPPFVRSVGGNLLFGNLSDHERRQMQTALKRLTRNLSANITAGLGTVFTLIGHQLLKEGGYIALVLPRALLSGVAWEDTRKLIGQNYDLRFVITSHEPGAWNFSENTKLSECMIVARKRETGERQQGNDSKPVKKSTSKKTAQSSEVIPTKVINLWRKPASSIEALSYARAINSTPGITLEDGIGTDDLMVGDDKVGEVIICPTNRGRAGNWNVEAAFSQTDLCRAAFYLSNNKLYVPSIGLVGDIPLVALNKLGTLGADTRDIHDGFTLTTTTTPYRAFWGHTASETRTLAQSPSNFLRPRARAIEGRHLKDAIGLWGLAGRLLIAERLRLTTVHVVSVCLDTSALSSTWWEFRPFEIENHQRRHYATNEEVEKILTLWFNSTLGILSIIAARVDTEGAWIKLKKQILKEIQVINPHALAVNDRRKIIKSYDKLANSELMPITQINSDKVRAQIDKTVLAALGIEGDLEALREMLVAEPILRS